MGRFSTDPPDDETGPSEDDQCAGCANAYGGELVYPHRGRWYCSSKCAWDDDGEAEPEGEPEPYLQLHLKCRTCGKEWPDCGHRKEVWR